MTIYTKVSNPPTAKPQRDLCGRLNTTNQHWINLNLNKKIYFKFFFVEMQSVDRLFLIKKSFFFILWVYNIWWKKGSPLFFTAERFSIRNDCCNRVGSYSEAEISHIELCCWWMCCSSERKRMLGTEWPLIYVDVLMSHKQVLLRYICTCKQFWHSYPTYFIDLPTKPAISIKVV